MNLPETFASVRMDGTYLPLGNGITTAGGLKFHLTLENKAENLYSWVVHLENDSDLPSPRIQEFLGLDLRIPLTGKAQLNTLRGDDCTIYSFYPESFRNS